MVIFGVEVRVTEGVGVEAILVEFDAGFGVGFQMNWVLGCGDVVG